MQEGGLGLEVTHLIREQILSCKAFQHGRVGGRNGNDGQEKTNDKKNNNGGILFVENHPGKITFLLLMLPWKHRKFLSSALG